LPPNTPWPRAYVGCCGGGCRSGLAPVFAYLPARECRDLLLRGYRRRWKVCAYESRQQVCDAPRRPGLHAHDTGVVSALITPLVPLVASVTSWAVLGPPRKRVGNRRSPRRAGDRCLQLFALNKECLVGAGHQPAPIVSLTFVHTARRCYQWQKNKGLRRWLAGGLLPSCCRICPMSFC